jgi:hypothetical protein
MDCSRPALFRRAPSARHFILKEAADVRFREPPVPFAGDGERCILAEQ